MEIFLLYLLDQEEGERLGDPGVDGMHEHPPLGQQAAEYMPCQLSRSNKRWHSHWFYLKNDPTAPFPVFSGRLVEEVPPLWPWGPPIKEKKMMHELLEAIVFLKTHVILEASAIGGYNARREAH